MVVFCWTHVLEWVKRGRARIKLEARSRMKTRRLLWWLLRGLRGPEEERERERRVGRE